MIAKLVRNAVLATAAAGAVAAAAAPALADVACNRFGECWHVPNRFTGFPRHAGIRFHPDAWRAAHMQGRYHWQNDHEGRGYWYHGAWRTF